MKRKTLARIIASGIGVVGIMSLVAVIYPIARYKAQANQKYPELIKPKETSYVAIETDVSKVDYTKAETWFDEDKEFTDQKFFYSISIPSLGIENAVVTYGGDDLVESLVQYPGTAPPGKIGNAVIFGHSVLPQFFNPEDYLTIFSTLPEIEIGKFILVDREGVSYRYKVENMFEVRPTDVQILSQDDSGSFLSLVTCTPPGDPFKPKRLVVRARLMPNLTADENSSN